MLIINLNTDGVKRNWFWKILVYLIVILAISSFLTPRSLLLKKWPEKVFSPLTIFYAVMSGIIAE